MSNAELNEKLSRLPNSTVMFLIKVLCRYIRQDDVCDLVIQQLQDHRVVLVSFILVYRGLTDDEMKHAHKRIRYRATCTVYHQTEIWTVCSVYMPVNFIQTYLNSLTFLRKKKGWVVNASEVIISEGTTSAFHEKRVRNMMNMKLFVDTDANVRLRLARRIRRDTVELEMAIFTGVGFGKKLCGVSIIPSGQSMGERTAFMYCQRHDLPIDPVLITG
ncbi:hypothetical protein L6164_010955 [Bauhinia variegata]|uniref:Uncharacterized protein n=1 Tax=Bauhinia variegata TaxID=167791 RepID=A0ACB9P5G2_BAUVA|nr:hypothetical protein L6164_010955 [Bauhinia variegata]